MTICALTLVVFVAVMYPTRAADPPSKPKVRAITAFPKLPELWKTIRELKKKVEELEKNVKPNTTSR